METSAIKIPFGASYPDAFIGDRVAYWFSYTDVINNKKETFLLRRCGFVIAYLGTDAVFVEDEFLAGIEDPVAVGRDMLFMPGDNV
jgi:hypothetical protein